MNTADQIKLKKAEAKYTKAKAVVVDDSTPQHEKTYQKAKAELAVLRISLRGHTPHQKPGSAVAEPKTLKAKATKPR